MDQEGGACPAVDQDHSAPRTHSIFLSALAFGWTMPVLQKIPSRSDSMAAFEIGHFRIRPTTIAEMETWDAAEI